MFIGRLLATVVLPYMGIVVPINEMFVARVSNDHKKMTRWASFMICSLVLAVPTAWFIPTWVVIRYDLLWIMLYVLSASDAEVSEYLVTRYLNPHVGNVRMISSFASFAFSSTPSHISSSSSDDDDERDDDERTASGDESTISDDETTASGDERTVPDGGETEDDRMQGNGTSR